MSKPTRRNLFRDPDYTAPIWFDPIALVALGMFVYRSNGATDITLGEGGPEWSLKTLNGDVHLRQDGRSQ